MVDMDEIGEGRGTIELEEVDRILYIGLSMKLQLHTHAPYPFIFISHTQTFTYP